MQSNLNKNIDNQSVSNGLHIGIIMDGNGRWAAGRHLPRGAGHRAGVGALRKIVQCAPQAGIGVLTVYAFSVDNWTRPPAEIAGLMQLIVRYLRNETEAMVKAGVRLSVIGRRDRLPKNVIDEIERAESQTRNGKALHLRIALDYSARDAILQAAAMMECGAEFNRDAFSRQLNGDCEIPDIDLIIRTSGEQRLSDFLLWESAYAELYFTDCLWPDFGAHELGLAISEFHRRNRRFGGIAVSEVSQNRAALV